MEKSMKIKILREGARIDEPAHKGDAGYDLYAVEDAIVFPFTPLKIPLGIAIELPKGTCGIIHQRSGMASKTGYDTIGNVIDAGYRGEIHAIVNNHSALQLEIRKGQKIAQLVIQPVKTPKIKVVKSLDETERGSKGFGSTGG